MSYELEFRQSALKEWKKLGAPIRAQFKKKLAERLECPRVAHDQLHGYGNVYKIKLRSAGFRLVYEVHDDRVVVVVVAVGKRERSKVYRAAAERLKD